jgi:tRNA A37 threonylcarbamoyladenosine modification protein TsaB
MLTLAFDTATSVATSALVRDGEVLAERASTAVRVLADAEELLERAGAEPRELSRLVAGTGPGSFTGVRIGLAAARALAFALDLPLAGVSTLDGAPVVTAPGELRLERGTACVGDGAVRYRGVLESIGAEIPRDINLHVPRARFHAELAREFVDPGEVEPIYLRLPDAEQVR